MAQAVALNAMFTQLAHRAQINLGQYLDASERYLRLALKAQGQCRATLETLAVIKNPPTVFARQANIAHGPQQVNNGPPPSHEPEPLTRAANQEPEPIKLLEAHGERLEFGAAGQAGQGDPVLAPVGARHRPPARLTARRDRPATRTAAAMAGDEQDAECHPAETSRGLAGAAWLAQVKATLRCRLAGRKVLEECAPRHGKYRPVARQATLSRTPAGILIMLNPSVASSGLFATLVHGAPALSLER